MSNYLELKSLKFKIKYNEKAFGENIVNQKGILLKTELKYQSNFHEYFENEAYKIKLNDIGKNIFEVIITANDTSKGIFQVSEKNYDILALIKLKVKDKKQNLTVEFIHNSEHIEVFNYDGYNPKLFTLVEGKLDNPYHYYLKPSITNFYPSIIECGSSDVLTIEGENLITDRARVLVTCIKDRCTFNAAIPQENIIYQSNNMIKAKIDCTMDVGHNTACGRIMSVHSGFVVEKYGVIAPFSYSPTKLKIIKDKK